jgi:hypothetical protein
MIDHMHGFQVLLCLGTRVHWHVRTKVQRVLLLQTDTAELTCRVTNESAIQSDGHGSTGKTCKQLLSDALTTKSDKGELRGMDVQMQWPIQQFCRLLR